MLCVRFSVCCSYLSISVFYCTGFVSLNRYEKRYEKRKTERCCIFYFTTANGVYILELPYLARNGATTMQHVLVASLPPPHLSVARSTESNQSPLARSH